MPDTAEVLDAPALHERVLALWNEGQTKTFIAQRLGVTRGQVSAALDRARNAGATICAHDQSQSNAVTLLTGGHKVARLPVLAALPLAGEPVPFVARRARQCGWIVGEVDGGETLCCGATIDGLGPYCPGHKRLAYVPRGARA